MFIQTLICAKINKRNGSDSMFLSMLASKSGIWPWLFDRDDDFGVFLRLGDLEIRWYAICILLGAVIALVRCRYELKKKGLPQDFYDNFFLSVIPISILGARLWYCISEPSSFMKGNFFDSFLAILGFTGKGFALSGLAVQGGVLAGLIWGICYFKFIKKRYPVSLHVDLIVPAIFIGQIFGRWGNFFNGEVYGKLVERESISWFIPKFIINNCTEVSQAGAGMVHIPLFYVEMLLNLVGYVLIGYVAWRFWKKFRKPFQIACLYFIWYGVVRICLEPLRESDYIMTREIFGIEVRTSILMSALFIVGGILAFIFFAIYYRKLPYEKLYVNEEADLLEKQEQERKEAELQEKIAAKKAEIRARKAKEKGLLEKENNHE